MNNSVEVMEIYLIFRYNIAVRTILLTKLSEKGMSKGKHLKPKCTPHITCRPLVLCHENLRSKEWFLIMKPTTDRMLNRIKDVYMFILNKGEVTTQDLVEEFNITPRTIQRDLNVLAFNDLVMSPSRGKWTTTKKKVKMTS